jgi:hypothetical protein
MLRLPDAMRGAHRNLRWPTQSSRRSAWGTRFQPANPGHRASPPIASPERYRKRDGSSQYDVTPKPARPERGSEWAAGLNEGNDYRHGEEDETAKDAHAVTINESRIGIGDRVAPEAAPRPDAEKQRQGCAESEDREGDRRRKHSRPIARILPNCSDVIAGTSPVRVSGYWIRRIEALPRMGRPSGRVGRSLPFKTTGWVLPT